MTKEEYKIRTLFSVCRTMQKVCDDLICFPELKEKALALREAIQKEYETAESGPETESSPCPKQFDLNSVIDYLETSLQKGKRVWCFCPTVSFDVTCNPEEIKKMILELKSDADSYGSHLVILEKGYEGPRFHKEIPRSDYDRTKCFLEMNNSTNFVKIQYYD